MKEKQAGYRWREKADSTLNPWVVKSLAILLGVSFALSGTAPASELFYEQVEAATQFSDDSNIRDYSREAVESLISSGAIKGYPDGTFKPQGTITRLEFLSMCANACDPGLKKINKGVQEAKDYVENGLSYYTDSVQTEKLEGLWGKDLIVGCEFLGIGTPFENDGSGLNIWQQPVKRHEAADIMADCISKLKGESLIKDYSLYDLNKTIADWYSNVSNASDYPDSVSLCRNAYSVADLYILGILQGDQDGAFHPQSNLTREDSAIMIQKCKDASKRDTSRVTYMKKVDPYAGVKVGTIKQADESRRDCVPGDTFIDATGKSTVLKLGKANVLGEGQAVGTDLGRRQKSVNNVIENGTTSDGTYFRLGARYITNPSTNESHWNDQWNQIQEAYKPTTPGTKDGEIRTFGLGGWCKYEWNAAGNNWICWDYNSFQ